MPETTASAAQPIEYKIKAEHVDNLFAHLNEQPYKISNPLIQFLRTNLQPVLSQQEPPIQETTTETKES